MGPITTLGMGMLQEFTIDPTMAQGSSPTRVPSLKKARGATIIPSITVQTITRGIMSSTLGITLTTPIACKTLEDVDSFSL